MITIVNYGMGNLGSVENMLKHLGIPGEISGELSQVKKASKIILPGVGAFDSAMERINSSGLRDVLDHKATVEQIPILGICLGMQLITRSSQEGAIPGLGWVEAETKRFQPKDGLKVPHMGWNHVVPVRETALTQGLTPDSRFYFVHSYYVEAENEADFICKTDYGVQFDSIISRDNIFGAQFHPEKSHKYGMRFLKNFSEI